MSVSTKNTPSFRLPRIGAIGIALAGGLLLAGQAAAIQPLAISAVAMASNQPMLLDIQAPVGIFDRSKRRSTRLLIAP